MAQIRYEINLETTRALAATSSSIQLLRNNWSGIITIWFEVVAKVTSGTGTVTLQRWDNGTNDATLTFTETSYTRKRIKFTPSLAGAEYKTALSGGTGLVVNASRIVIIQSDQYVNNAETTINIGSSDVAKTNTADATQTSVKYWTYTAANWNGTVTFYAEANWKTSATNTATITLQEDDGSFGTWSNKVTIVNAVSNTNTTRTRSAAFTPTATGRHYRIVAKSSTTKSSYTIFGANIIVNQQAAFDQSQLLSGTAAGFGQTAVVRYRGQGFIPAQPTLTGIGFKRVVGTKGLKVYIDTADANSIPTHAVGSELYSFVISNADLSSDFKIYSLPKPLTLTVGVQYCFYLAPWDTSTNLYADDYADMQFTGTSTAYANGKEITNTNGVWSNETLDAYFATTTAETGSITKLEPQYLLLNNADLNTATTLQTMQTLYTENTNGVEVTDAHDWAGVTNTYTHVIDSDNASNSAKLQDIDNANTDVTNSTATGNNVATSSAMTMPTSGHNIDTTVTNTTGIIIASRIVVAVSTVGQYKISDSVTLTESVALTVSTAVSTPTINVSDSITVSESTPMQPRLVSFVNVSDGVAVTENIKVDCFSPAVSDNVTVTENIGVILAPQIRLSDGVTVTDTPVLNFSLSINVSDTVYTTRTNYIVNPDFETNTLYWATAGASIVQDTGTVYNRSNSLKMTGTTADDRTYVTVADGLTPVVGRQYTFSGYVRGTGTIRLWVYDGSGDQYSTDIVLTGTFTRYSLTFTAQATSGLFAGFRQKNTEALTCYIDAVQLEVGSSATTFFDGATSQAAWTGSADNSTSIYYSDSINVTLAHNVRVSDTVYSADIPFVKMPIGVSDPTPKKAIHVGSYSIDYNSLSQAEIDAIVLAIVTAIPNADYIAIGTYLDYTTQLSRWASAIHAQGKKMWLRSAGYNDWQGTNSVTQYTSSDFAERSTSQFVSFVNANYTIFSSGDIFEAVPDEPENNTMWNSTYGTIGSGAGLTAYNLFITDSITRVNTALSNHGVTGVITSYVGTNPSASKDVITSATAGELTAMLIDSYPEGTDTTAALMASDMQTQLTDYVVGSQNGKPYHITIGPNVHIQINETTQADVYSQYFSLIQSMVKGLDGITIWQAGNTVNDPLSRLFDYVAGAWVPRKATSVINTLFGDLKGTFSVRESTKVTLVPLINVSETVTITENVIVSQSVTNLSITVSDSVTVTENVKVELICLIRLSDSVIVSESVNTFVLGITISNLSTGSDTDGNSTSTTASVTPTSNYPLFVHVKSRTSISTDPNIPTITGNGITYTTVASLVIDTTGTSRERMTLFRGSAVSPSAGTIAIDFAGQNQTHVEWSIDQIQGVDVSNDSGAVVQFATALLDSVATPASSLTATLGAFVAADNATYAVLGSFNSTTVYTEGSGFGRASFLQDVAGAIVSEFKNVNDTTVDWSFNAPDVSTGIIAVELKSASTLTVNVSESITVNESIKLLLEALIRLSDTITVTESINDTLAYNALLSDTVTITESQNEILTHLVNQSDTVTVSETVRLEPTLSILVSDSVTLTENNLYLLVSFITLSDSITVSETILRDLTISKLVSDSVTVSENILLNNTLLINVSDGVTVSDSPLLNLVSLASVSERIITYESFGNAISLDGINGKIQSTAFPTPSTTTTPVTLAIWVRFGKDGINSAASQPIIDSYFTRIYARDSTSIRLRTDQSIAQEVGGVGSSPIPNGDTNWHLVVGTYNPTGGSNYTIKIYVDGALKATSSFSVLPTANYYSGVRLGSQSSSAFFTGDLADPRVFQYLFTDADVSNLYNSNIMPDGVLPVVWYPMLEASGTSVTDVTGNGVTGTISGGATLIESTTPRAGRVHIDFTAGVRDRTSVTETTTLTAPAFPINVSENVSLTESVSLQPIINITVSDSVTATESIKLLEVSFIQLSETITVTENAQASIGTISTLDINVSDTVTLTENALLDEQIKIAVSDGVTLTETVIPRLESYIRVSDGIAVSDSVLTTQAQNLSVSDSVLVNKPYGHALRFDGVNGYAVKAPDPIFNATSALTITAWVYPTAFGHVNVIACKGDGNSAYNYQLSLSEAGEIIVGGGDYPGSSTIASLNDWNYIVYVFDGSTHKFYLNGLLVKTINSSVGLGSTNTFPLYIGWNNFPGQVFEGDIDELKIYLRPFTAAEVFNSYHNKSISTSNLIVEYKMDEVSGVLVPDTSGNSLDATLQGSPTPSWVVSTIESLPEVVLASQVNRSDSVTVSEYSSLTHVLNITVSDNLTLTENVNLVVPIKITVDESIIVNEASLIVFEGGVAVMQSIAVSEDIQVVLSDPQVNVSDSIAVTNSPTVRLISNISVSDQVVVSENVELFAPLEITVSDQVTIAEYVEPLLIVSIVVSEVITVSEALNIIYILLLSVLESITVSEYSKVEIVKLKKIKGVIQPNGIDASVITSGINVTIKVTGRMVSIESSGIQSTITSNKIKAKIEI